MNFFIALLLSLAASISFAEPTVSLEAAKWLAGCWSSEDGQTQTTEVWMHPAGNAMLGMSRTIADGKMKEYEFVQIVRNENGDIHYVARPSGQSEAAFKLVEQTSTSLKFENQEHDFPQRILYRLKEDGASLVARIEGKSGEKEKGFEWVMQRSKCE